MHHCEENRLVAIGLPDRARALMWGNHLQRTGGGPPMVAVLGTSQATLIDNVIEGGGVAGILVEGRARLLANQLNGNGNNADGFPPAIPARANRSRRPGS